MFGLVVRFDLKDGSGEVFDALTSEAVALIKEAEPGTLVYACHAVDGAPESRVFYELYRDRDAFEDHERQEHVRRFHEKKAWTIPRPSGIASRTTAVAGGYPK